MRRSSGPGRRAADPARPAGRRCRLVCRRDVRPEEARRGLRLHPGPRLPPDPGRPRGHRRGAAHPPQEGVGEHLARLRALSGRAARPRRARRRRRAEAAAGRSGFWNNHTFNRLDRSGWQFSIGVRLQPVVRTAIEAIDETDWQTPDDYPKTSIAQIAETTPGDRRLVVRRVRTLDRQGQLLPSWELFPFVTNRTDDLATVEAEHRQHAVIEIRDLKDQALAHFPSGRLTANAAWTVIAALAHNLLRWTSVIGLPDHTIRAARTVRRRLLALPGRLTRTARRWTLHLPARWPWQHDFIRALTRIRALAVAA